MTEAPRSHSDLRMTGHAEVWIAVAPPAAYAAVTDLPRMGEWSPENRGGEWMDADGVAVGATFRGKNQNAHAEWETVLTVTEVEPARRFAFCVAPPGSVGTAWCYTFEPRDDGTLVTESFQWQWTPQPAEGFRGRVGRMALSEAAAVVAARQEHLRESITATLAALKAALEEQP